MTLAEKRYEPEEKPVLAKKPIITVNPHNPSDVVKNIAQNLKGTSEYNSIPKADKELIVAKNRANLDLGDLLSNMRDMLTAVK